MDQEGSSGIQLIVSDQSQLGRLQAYLSWAVPEVTVLRVAGRREIGSARRYRGARKQRRRARRDLGLARADSAEASVSALHAELSAAEETLEREIQSRFALAEKLKLTAGNGGRR